jgi:L-arabinose transport system substrate-binding protein
MTRGGSASRERGDQPAHKEVHGRGAKATQLGVKSRRSSAELEEQSVKDRAPTRATWRLVAPAVVTLAIVAACNGNASSPPASGTAPSPSAAASSPSSAAPSAAGAALFVAIDKSATQQYFIDQQAGFTAKVTELGGTAKTYNVELDTNLAISTLNDAIALGPKGIAITVPDQTIGPAVAKAAADAGIALVATDDSIKDSAGKDVPLVGFDYKEMGQKVGDKAAELLKTAGWLTDSSKKVGVLSVEVQTLTVCNDRTDAAKAAVVGAGVKATNVFSVPYSGQTDSAQTAAGPIITAHPDITNWIVFSCNDEGVLGTLNSLATAGAKTDDIIAVGLGANEACKPWAANQPSGFKAALFISGKDVGSAAAQALWNKAMNGTAIPPLTVAKTTMVDPTSYAALFTCAP